MPRHCMITAGSSEEEILKACRPANPRMTIELALLGNDLPGLVRLSFYVKRIEIDPSSTEWELTLISANGGSPAPEKAHYDPTTRKGRITLLH